MKKILILFATISIIGGGCAKDYLSSLQNNPNAPTTDVATPPLILPGVLTGITNIVNDFGSYQNEAEWIGYWNGQPGYGAFNNIFDYNMTNSSPQLWDNYYGVLTNLNALVQQSSGTANADYRDIANVLEAICFQNLVDLYNDIPYTEALQGAGDFYPKYDNASDVYDSLTAKLDVAIADINANLNNVAVTLPASDDVMFGGNMQNWLQFANAVKLRLLVRESNISAKQPYIASEISKTASLGYLDVDALVNPGYISAKPGNIWANFGVSPSGSINVGTGEFGANQAAIDFYTATQDVRLGYFYASKNISPTDPNFYIYPDSLLSNFAQYVSQYAGNYCGLQKAVAGGSSDLGPGIIQSPGQSAVMMTAADSYFNQAEATVRGWLPGGNAAAQTLYQAGITKSYEYLGVGGSTSAADAYAAAYYGQNLAFVAFPVGASTDSLVHTILEQKWAALNGINIEEPYADWRRTFDPSLNSGYPLVPGSISPTRANSYMPFRYLYPTEEQNNNNAAWTAAGGATVNVFTSKIFWMQ